MPELKRMFLEGKMETSVDPRLVQPGTMRYAENVNISRTEGASIGALENLEGNQFVQNSVFKNNENFYTLGAVTDELNNRIYWLFKGPSTEGIYELDISLDDRRFLTPEAEASGSENDRFGKPLNRFSRILEFSTEKRIFNFSVDFLITGINVVGGLLYWTDGLNPPRKVNIDRFRGSGNYYQANSAGRFITETDGDPNTPGLEASLRGVPGGTNTVDGMVYNDQLESDIDPSFDGEGVELVGFSQATIDALVPVVEGTSELRPEFPGDLINVGKRPPLYPPTIRELSEGAEVSISHFGADIGDLQFTLESEEFDADATLVGGTFTNDMVAHTITSVDEEFRVVYFEPALTKGLGSPIIVDRINIVEQKLVERGDYLYDNFVYFAYRYKYRDGETTALSPFSRAAFQPRAITQAQMQNPTATSLEALVNTIAGVNITYDTGNPEVTEIEIIVTSSRNLNYYSIATRNKADLGLKSSTPEAPVMDSFPFTNNKVYRTLPESEITRIFDGVPLRAKAQEFTGNRLVYGNYVQNYELRTENETGPILVPDFDLGQAEEGTRFGSLQPCRSVKADRNYEVGIVYLDKEGRQTPVLVAQDNTHTVPFEDAIKRNILQVEIKSPAPYWASAYRFFIKQTQGGYETVIPVATYKTGDDKAIVRITGDDINKVTYETRFVMKRGTAGVETIKRIFSVEPQRNATISEDDTITGESEERTRARVTTIDPDFLISYDEAISLNSQISANTSAEELSEAKSDFYFVITPQNPEDIEAIKFEGAAFRNSGLILETIPVLDSVLDIYYEHGSTFICANGLHSNIIGGQNISGSSFQEDVNGVITPITVKLPNYFNCFSYSTGVEERKVLGAFNETGLTKGIKASTVSESYQQDDKKAFLIHSGIFNDNRNLNRLNEFNTSMVIEKELDVSEGSIQKLHTRDTNLIVFQEDKVINVPINKNLIQSAGGGGSLTTGSSFFGTERSYSGEWGISTNPESFCTYGTKIFFADKNRGVLCQLANDGITEISNNGMNSWVRDNIADAHLIIGQYDDYHKQALFTFKNVPDLATDDANEETITISYDGRPDPRNECNRTPDLMVFKSYYAFVRNQNIVALGDVVFTDQARTVLFDGNYRWYRVQSTSTMGVNTYNQLYQISPYGLITGIEGDCAENQKPYLGRQLFDISSESFDNRRDACANGSIDSIAYHDTPTTPEVVVGDNVYDEADDLTPSSRTGWYIISEGVKKFVINLDNGEVKRKIDCDEISLNRRPILGSEVINLSSGLPPAQRNLDLCSQSFAQHVYWFDGIERLPPPGTVIYENNHNADITVGDWDETEEYIQNKVVLYTIDSITRKYRSLSTSNTGNTPEAATSAFWEVITGNLYLQFSRGDFIEIEAATANASVTVGSAAVGASSVIASTASEALRSFVGLTFNSGYQTITNANPSTGVIEFVPPIAGAITSGTSLSIEGTAARYNVEIGQGIVSQNGVCSEKLCFISPADLFKSTDMSTNPFNFTFLGVNGNDVQNCEITYLVEGERTYGPFMVNAVDENGLLFLASTLLDTNNETLGSATPLGLTIEEGEVPFILPSPIDPLFESEDFPSVRVIITSLCYRGFTSLGVNPAYISSAPLTTGTNQEKCAGTIDPNTMGEGQVVYYDSDPNVERQYFYDPEREMPVNVAGQYAVSFADPEDLEGGGVIAQLETLNDIGQVVDVNQTIFCVAPFNYDLGFTSQDNQNAKQAACDVPTNVNVYSDQMISNFPNPGPPDSPNPNAVKVIKVRTPLGTLTDGDDGFYTVGGEFGVIRELTSGFLGFNEAQACSAGYTMRIDGSTAVGNASVRYTGTSTDTTNAIVRATISPFSFSASLRANSMYELTNPSHIVSRDFTNTSAHVVGDSVIVFDQGFVQSVLGYTFTHGGTNYTVNNFGEPGDYQIGVTPTLDSALSAGTTITLSSGTIAGDTYTFAGSPQSLDATRKVVFSGTTTMTTGYTASLSISSSGVTGGTPNVSYSGNPSTNGSNSIFRSDTSDTGTIVASVSAPTGYSFSGNWTIGGRPQSGNSGTYTFPYTNTQPTDSATISGTLVENPPSSCVNGNVNVSGVTGGSATAVYNWSNGASGTATCGTPGTAISLDGSATAPSGFTFSSGPTSDGPINTVFPANGTTVGIGSVNVTGTLAEEAHATATWVSSTSDDVCNATGTETFNVSSTTLAAGITLYADTTGTATLATDRYLRTSTTTTANFKWTASTATMSAETACPTIMRELQTFNVSTSGCATTITTAQYYVAIGEESSGYRGITTLFSAATGTSKPSGTIYLRASSSGTSSYRQYSSGSIGISTACQSATYTSTLPIGGSLLGAGLSDNSGTASVVGAVSGNLKLSISGFVTSGSWTPNFDLVFTNTATNATTTLEIGEATGAAYMGSITALDSNEPTLPIGEYTWTYTSNATGTNITGAITFSGLTKT